MENYLPNNDMTYVENPLVAENVFLTRKAEDTRLPLYEESRDQLPKPIWDGHDAAIACYDYAWRIAFDNLRKANGQAGFVSNYIDTAFNGCLFMWDSSFIVMFGKYASRVFDFQKTLDNLYSHQHKDGFICREICEDELGEHFSRHDPSSTGPNVMPWAEWESFCQTGNRERLKNVYPPLLAYHLWLKKYHTWQDGTYWSTGWGCGMDNQPRLPAGYDPWFDHGHMVWVDTCIQQVLSAKILLFMARELGRDKEPVTEELREEIGRLTKVINESLWCETDAYFYDRYRDGTLNHVKSVGAYWALLADILPPERLDRFVAHLNNPAEFRRPNRVPTLSADHPEYDSMGHYWKGSVWAPTNYMVLKGLEKNGYHKLAYEIARDCLDNVVQVFEKTGTIWENYAPESASEGSVARERFIGWSGLFPISILLEYVFGIHPHASENKIVWYVNRTERHGVTRYPLGENTVDLLCEARTSEEERPRVTVRGNVPVTVEVHWNGNSCTETFARK